MHMKKTAVLRNDIDKSTISHLLRLSMELQKSLAFILTALAAKQINWSMEVNLHPNPKHPRQLFHHHISSAWWVNICHQWTKNALLSE